MPKIAAFIMTSLDGFFDGPTPWELDWHHVDEEFNDFAVQQLDASGGLIFGRTTYQGMAQFWPTQQATAEPNSVVSRMNQLPKFVISRTLDQPEPKWNNTRLIKQGVADELASLKQESGRDLLVLGSAVLTASLMEMGVLDELRIMVNPVLLVRGRLLFESGKQKTELKLLGNRTFKSSNVLLTYQPLTS